MQLGSIVLASVAGMVGLLAGRITRPAPAVVIAAPAARHDQVRVIAPPVVAPAPADLSGDEAEGADDGIDIADAIALAKAEAGQLAAEPAARGVIRGVVHDASGELAVGATVVMTGPAIEGEHVALTDENGTYALSGLPAGYYTQTIYFGDTTTMHENVMVTDTIPQTYDQTLEPARNEVPIIDVDSTDRGVLVTIPVPSRTFEAVLGAAAGSEDDGDAYVGVSSIENRYVTDEE